MAASGRSPTSSTSRPVNPWETQIRSWNHGGVDPDEPFSIRTARITRPVGCRRHRGGRLRRSPRASTAPSVAPVRPPAPADSAAPEPSRRHTPRPSGRSDPTAASSSAGSSASARWQAGADRRPSRLRHEVQRGSREQGQGLPVGRDLRQQGRSQHLATQIAAGNPPDIIGPVGVEGLNLFLDHLLDVKPLIESPGLRHDQVPGRGTSSPSARTARRSASRTGPTRRSSITTRSCSTRPSLAVPADQDR